MEALRKNAVFGVVWLLVFHAAAAQAGDASVGICHIPPGNPDNAHIISVDMKAVPAHIRNHGDEILPEDGMCTVGVGECAVHDFLACTAEGLVCDAEPGVPPEEVEITCDDGKDNDCDGLIDDADDDCVLAEFSATFPPSDQSAAWDAFETQLSGTAFYNQIQFFSDTDPGYTCTGPEADTICQAIRTQTDESCAFAPAISLPCQGNVWSVGLCGGTELSVNTPHCECQDPGTTIRAEIDAACGGNFDVYGGVNANTCSGTTTTMTVRCR